MFGLSEIILINEHAACKAKRETEVSRHCSYSRCKLGSVVLHSAKQRNTVFLPAGREAKDFLIKHAVRFTQAGRDRLIESYFEAV